MLHDKKHSLTHFSLSINDTDLEKAGDLLKGLLLLIGSLNVHFETIQ